jgi:predicted metal-dependent peptidase
MKRARELDKHYLDAVNYLDGNFAYFLTHVLNIGNPEPTGAVPTAAVAVPHDSSDIDRDFKFLFNLDFARNLSISEMAFVLGHETMHIVLNHLKLMKRDEFTWSSTCTEDCKARTLKSQKDQVADPEKGHKGICHECAGLQRKTNIAADCVINDYLIGMGMTPPENLYFGKKVVGYNAANATVTQVFYDIPDDFMKCDGNCQPGGSGEPCDGSCGGAKADDFTEIDDHGWMRESNEGQEDAAGDIASGNPHTPDELDQTKSKDEGDYQGNLNPGKGAGSKQEFSELEGVGLKWAELLEKVDPFLFREGPKPRATWNRNPRKAAAFGERTRLPIYDQGIRGIGAKKPAIVMAIDTSGSIGKEQANQFINMARSVPLQKVKLWTCTFTDRYMELDLEDPEWVSGGTCFDAISSYIEDIVMPNNHKRYPTAVVVVSDGAAEFPSKFPTGNEDAWWWLLTRQTDKMWDGVPFPGHIEDLDDYRKG